MSTGVAECKRGASVNVMAQLIGQSTKLTPMPD